MAIGGGPVRANALVTLAWLYARPGYSRSYYWGNGIRVGSGFFFGGIDWRQRHVSVINYNYFYYRNVNRRPNLGHRWLHDPDHRHGAPYRSPALHEHFNPVPRNTDARGEFRGRYPTAPQRPAGNPQPPRQVPAQPQAQQQPQAQRNVPPPVQQATPAPQLEQRQAPATPSAPRERERSRGETLN